MIYPYDGAIKKFTGKLQVLQNCCLHTFLPPKKHIPTIRLHKICIVANLEMRRKIRLQLDMFKQKHNFNIVNTRNVATRIHDAVLFTTFKPNSRKYKNNVIYKRSIVLNSLNVAIMTYIILKDMSNEKLISEVVPNL